MLITIIVVAYKNPEAVRATLESIASQAYRGGEVEVVVVDGSEDLQIARECDGLASARKGFSVRLISEPDRGVYDGMGKGVAAASGRYVHFLNSGDRFLDPDGLGSVVAALEASSSDWLISRAMHGMGTGAPVREIPHFPHNKWLHALGMRPHCHQATWFSREIFNKLGGYDDRFGFAADFDLILRFALRSQPQLLDVRVIFYEGGGISSIRGEEIPRLIAESRRNRVYDGSRLLVRIDAAFLALQLLRRRRINPRIERLRSTMRRSGLAVVDTNPLNPYGVELVRVLRQSGHCIQFFSPRSESDGFRLAGERPDRLIELWSYLLARIADPLRFLFSVIKNGTDEVIVVWVRDSWWAAVLIAISLRTRVFAIDHNPFDTGRAGKNGRVVRLMRSRCTNSPVHDRRYVSPSSALISHPSYRSTVASCGSESMQRARSDGTELPRIVYIGRVRDDKGAEDLPAIVNRLGNAGMLIFAGAEGVPAAVGDAANRIGANILVTGVLSDRELVSIIEAASLVIAPYTNPTQSGSLILCLTLNAPALAYDAGMLHELLPRERLIPVAEAEMFAATAMSMLQAGGSRRWRMSAEELDETCAVHWGNLLRYNR